MDGLAFLVFMTLLAVAEDNDHVCDRPVAAWELAVDATVPWNAAHVDATPLGLPTILKDRDFNHFLNDPVLLNPRQAWTHGADEFLNEIVVVVDGFAYENRAILDKPANQRPMAGFLSFSPLMSLQPASSHDQVVAIQVNCGLLPFVFHRILTSRLIDGIDDPWIHEFDGPYQERLSPSSRWIACRLLFQEFCHVLQAESARKDVVLHSFDELQDWLESNELKMLSDLHATPEVRTYSNAPGYLSWLGFPSRGFFRDPIWIDLACSPDTWINESTDGDNRLEEAEHRGRNDVRGTGGTVLKIPSPWWIERVAISIRKREVEWELYH